MFLVDRRTQGTSDSPELRDRAYAFQPQMEVRSELPFPHKPVIHAFEVSDYDETVARLHYADSSEYPTCHGTFAEWDVTVGRCHFVRTGLDRSRRRSPYADHGAPEPYVHDVGTQTDRRRCRSRRHAQSLRSGLLGMDWRTVRFLEARQRGGRIGGAAAGACSACRRPHGPRHSVSPQFDAGGWAGEDLHRGPPRAFSCFKPVVLSRGDLAFEALGSLQGVRERRSNSDSMDPPQPRWESFADHSVAIGISHVAVSRVASRYGRDPVLARFGASDPPVAVVVVELQWIT